VITDTDFKLGIKRVQSTQ